MLDRVADDEGLGPVMRRVPRRQGRPRRRAGPRGGEQRQAEDGRVVALDALEQVDARGPRPDSRRRPAGRAGAGQVEIAAMRRGVERPHGRAARSRRSSPRRRRPARAPRRNGARGSARRGAADVRRAARRSAACGGPRRRGEHLVGAEHEPVRVAPADRERLLARRAAPPGRRGRGRADAASPRRRARRPRTLPCRPRIPAPSRRSAPRRGSSRREGEGRSRSRDGACLTPR